MCVCVCVCVCARKPLCVCLCICACVSVYLSVGVHLCMRECVYVCMCVCDHVTRYRMCLSPFLGVFELIHFSRLPSQNCETFSKVNRTEQHLGNPSISFITAGDEDEVDFPDPICGPVKLDLRHDLHSGRWMTWRRRGNGGRQRRRVVDCSGGGARVVFMLGKVVVVSMELEREVVG